MDSSQTPAASLSQPAIVTNDGPADAAAAKLTDVLPGGTSFASVTTNLGTCSGTKTVTCTSGSLASGSSVSVIFTVNRTSTMGAINNTATVTATTFDFDKADNSVKVRVQ